MDNFAEEIIQRLRATEQQMEQARDFVGWFRKAFRDSFASASLWGSLSRGTAVHEYSDVDIIVVVDDKKIVGASALLNYVRDVLLHKFPHAEIREQNHSIGWFMEQNCFGQHFPLLAAATCWVDIVPVQRGKDGDATAPQYMLAAEKGPVGLSGLDRSLIPTRKPFCDHTPMSRSLILFFKKWNYVHRYNNEENRFKKPLSSTHIELFLCLVTCGGDAAACGFTGNEFDSSCVQLNDPILVIREVFRLLHTHVRHPAKGESPGEGTLWNESNLCLYLHRDQERARWAEKTVVGARDCANEWQCSCFANGHTDKCWRVFVQHMHQRDIPSAD